MKNISDTAAIFSYHRRAMSIHGKESNRALGWREPESQLIRFKELVDLADLNNCTVLDAGCGHGDLSIYLQRIYPAMKYIGVEQIPELLEVAIERFKGMDNIVFQKADFMRSELPCADYIMACGSLNYYNHDREFIFKAIKTLFNSSKCGLAFNLLSRVMGLGLLVAYDPQKIFSYCKTLSPKVILKNDYSDEDFTIYMYKH